MEEILDLVNERDEIIGEVWRSQTIGHPEFIFREVAVLIFDKDKQLLLQKRSLSKKSYPGYWMISAGGHVGKGQNPDEVVHKEMREELGFDVPVKLVNKQLMTYPGLRSMAYCYIGEYRGELIVTQKEEVVEAKFFSPDEFEVLCRDEKVEPSSAQWCRDFWKDLGL